MDGTNVRKAPAFPGAGNLGARSLFRNSVGSADRTGVARRDS
jgi:hypothetical protein